MAADELGPALRRVRMLVTEADRSPMGAMKKIMQDNPDIVNMAIGEANFDPPERLIEIAQRMLADRVDRRSLYTPTRGLPEIRQAVARFVGRTFASTVDPDENVLMTVGGTEALYLAIKILVAPGEKVLLPDPGWGPCAAMMKRRGAEIQHYTLGRTSGAASGRVAGAASGRAGGPATGRTADAVTGRLGSWTVDPDAIVAALDPSVKVLVVNSPSNPTGAMLSAEGWRRVMEAAKAYDVLVISDEVYHTYSYIGEYVSALPLDPSFDNLVVINSFSKTLAIMGWRLGFVLAHPWLIRQMDVYKENVSACSPSIAQWAVAEYLDGSADYQRWAHALCRENMERAVARLDAIPGVECAPPQGGFYLFPDFSGIEADSAALAERLLRGGVAVATGGAFGPHGAGCARLLVSAYWDDIDKALGRIERALKVGYHASSQS